MIRFFSWAFSLGFFLFVALFPQTIVRAQNSPNGLTVSPAFQEITLDQGDTKAEFSVSVVNNTTTSVTLRVAVLDFGSLDESGGVAFLGASNNQEKKYALASWMYPEKDVFLLEPGAMKEVLVTIENRETLAPGGHYGALTFTSEDTSQGNIVGDTVSVHQLFSTLVFMKKVGGEIYDLSLRESNYKNNFIRFQNTLRLRFQNSGNTHVVPRGTVVVTDPIGRVVAKGIINQESALILPEAFRVYPVHLDTLRISLIPGRYTMKIAYRYDGKDEFEVVVIRFFFVPLPIILAGLALIGIGGRYVDKRRKLFDT